MSDKTRLVIYVPDPSSRIKLPQEYLSLPDVVVKASDGGGSCQRCDMTWSSHAWIVTSGSDFVPLDCSENPRSVRA